MKALAFALAFAIAFVVVPVAAAQVPGAPVNACGPISIPTAPTSPAPVRPGGRADLVVSVANGGQLGATVNVSADTASTGWIVVQLPAAASVGGGGTGSFTIGVQAGPNANGPATIRISASASCDSPLGANCGAACNAGSANTQATVPLQAPSGFHIPGLDNLNFPVEYLIAGIVLVGLASAIPFVMRGRKKGGIVADCPEPLKMVKPGRGTSFPIELRNAGKDAASAQFEVAAVPEGWSAFMPLPEVQLAGREARSLWLMVRSPQSAANGEAVDVELRVKDPRGNNTGLVKVRAEVQGAGEA